MIKRIRKRINIDKLIYSVELYDRVQVAFDLELAIESVVHFEFIKDDLKMLIRKSRRVT